MSTMERKCIRHSGNDKFNGQKFVRWYAVLRKHITLLGPFFNIEL